MRSAQSVFRNAAKALQRQRAALSDFRPTYLHEEVASRLADRLYDIKRDFPRLLEYKSSSGFLSTLLGEDKSSKITCCDTSSSLLSLVSKDARIETVLAPDDDLPFPADSFDAVISNLSLHWHNDLQGALSQINNCISLFLIFPRPCPRWSIYWSDAWWGYTI
jgi:NADH dehydrogenase [ubiquinone] 1 alpha subcomplex assembly factor 5